MHFIHPITVLYTDEVANINQIPNICMFELSIDIRLYLEYQKEKKSWFVSDRSLKGDIRICTFNIWASKDVSHNSWVSGSS